MEIVGDYSFEKHALFSDGPFTFDPGEIERGDFFDFTSMDEMLRGNPEQFTPPFCQLYRWYRENYDQ